MKQPTKILNIDVTQQVEIGSPGNKHNMTLYETARWCALLQGLDVITKKAKNLKINLDTDKTWIKPLALQKFVEEETPVAVAELKMHLDKVDEIRPHSI